MTRAKGEKLEELCDGHKQTGNAWHDYFGGAQFEGISNAVPLLRFYQILFALEDMLAGCYEVKE